MEAFHKNQNPYSQAFGAAWAGLLPVCFAETPRSMQPYCLRFSPCGAAEVPVHPALSILNEDSEINNVRRIFYVAEILRAGFH